MYFFNDKLIYFIKIVLTIIFTVFVIFYLSEIDLTKFLTLMKSIKLSSMFHLSALIFLTVGLKAIRLKILTPVKASFDFFFKIQSISIMLATFTPARIGEVVKIWFLKRKNLSIATATYIFIIERGTDILILTFFAAMYFFFSFNHYISVGYIILFSFMIGVGIVLWMIDQQRIPIFVKKLLSKWEIEDGINKNVGHCLILTIIIWGMEGIFVLIAVMSVNEHISVFSAIGIVGFSTISSMLSVLPLGIGSVDLSIGYFLKYHGLSMESITAVLLIMRFITVVILGIMGIFSAGFSIGNLQSIIQDSLNSKR